MSRPPKGRNELSIITALALSGMLISLQLTLMVPALPEIPARLGVSANAASWIITITLLTSTIGTPIVSRMADMYGRRGLLLVCMALVTAGSAIAALGMTFPTVLLGRALQGFAAAIVPIGVSLMRDLLSRKRAAGGIALMSGTMGVGSAIGLPLSGVLTELGGLAALFWVPAFMGAVFFILTIKIVPVSPARSGGRFDTVGTLLFTAGLTAAMVAISKAGTWGLTSPATLGLAAVSLAAFAVWIPHQLVNTNPVIDLRTSTLGPILKTNIASFFVAVGMFANQLLTIQEARAPLATGAGLGMPALTAGLILLPNAITMIAMTPVASRVLIRYGGRSALALGSGLIFTAYVFRLIAPWGLGPVIFGTLLVGIGSILAFAAMPTLIMDAAPPAETAAANGVNSLVRNLSGSVTAAAFGLLLTVAPWHLNPDYISPRGLTLAFAIVATCAAVGTVLALAVPKRPRLGIG